MTNGAAIGYALLAAKKMGFNKEKLVELERTMLGFMDLRTEEDAEEVYNNN
jgi:hypothetical protein